MAAWVVPRVRGSRITVLLMLLRAARTLPARCDSPMTAPCANANNLPMARAGCVKLAVAGKESWKPQWLSIGRIYKYLILNNIL